MSTNELLHNNIFIYPCLRLLNRRPKRTLYSKKYGVDLIRYTHAANTVVYSSNKIDGMLHGYQFVSEMSRLKHSSRIVNCSR